MSRAIIRKTTEGRHARCCGVFGEMVRVSELPMVARQVLR